MVFSGRPNSLGLALGSLDDLSNRIHVPASTPSSVVPAVGVCGHVCAGQRASIGATGPAGDSDHPARGAQLSEEDAVAAYGSIYGPPAGETIRPAAPLPAHFGSRAEVRTPAPDTALFVSLGRRQLRLCGMGVGRVEAAGHGSGGRS